MSTALPHLPTVSVVIPARDAEATIGSALDSVLAQDYEGSIEIIVADGSTNRRTSDVVRNRYPSVRLLPNPKQYIGYGNNIGIEASSSDIIVRCDAHNVLPPGYVSRAVATLQRTNAVNVGGRQNPVGTTFFERAVALGMGTLLGAGDARYRLGGPEGPVETVFLGSFRRDALVEVGGYDGTMTRGDDIDLNSRLRKNGGVVWFDPELVVDYRPRSSLRSLAAQFFDYGRWKRVVLLRHPTSTRLRHVAGALLLVTLVLSGCLVALSPFLDNASWMAGAAAFPLAYCLALLLGSLAVGIRRRETAAVILPIVLATMHLSWGSGFFFPTSSQGV